MVPFKKIFILPVSAAPNLLVVKEAEFAVRDAVYAVVLPHKAPRDAVSPTLPDAYAATIAAVAFAAFAAEAAFAAATAAKPLPASSLVASSSSAFSVARFANFFLCATASALLAKTFVFSS